MDPADWLRGGKYHSSGLLVLFLSRSGFRKTILMVVIEDDLTLHLNSVSDAPIQFLDAKRPPLITSLSNVQCDWKRTRLLSRISSFQWLYSHFDRTSNYFLVKKIKNKKIFFFNFFFIFWKFRDNWVDHLDDKQFLWENLRWGGHFSAKNWIAGLSSLM